MVLEDDDICSQAEEEEGESAGDESQACGEDPTQETEGAREPLCPSYVREFACYRVDWKTNIHAIKIGRQVDTLYWPDYVVPAPNPWFGVGPFRLRPKVVFWAPIIFFAW